MTGTPFIIGPDEKRLIADLIERAAAAPVAYETVREMAAQYDKLKGQNIMFDPFTISIPIDYTVTYTHEFQRPDVCCRHLSMSVNRPGRAPNAFAMQMLMDEFGFKNRLGQTPMYIEPLLNERAAINVIEPLDGDMSKLKKADTEPRS